jgi:hypothetical protein
MDSEISRMRWAFLRIIAHLKLRGEPDYDAIESWTKIGFDSLSKLHQQLHPEEPKWRLTELADDAEKTMQILAGVFRKH